LAKQGRFADPAGGEQEQVIGFQGAPESGDFGLPVKEVVAGNDLSGYVLQASVLLYNNSVVQHICCKAQGGVERSGS